MKTSSINRLFATIWHQTQANSSIRRLRLDRYRKLDAGPKHMIGINQNTATEKWHGSEICLWVGPWEALLPGRIVYKRSLISSRSIALSSRTHISVP
jgi:hypothetical protein